MFKCSLYLQVTSVDFYLHLFLFNKYGSSNNGFKDSISYASVYYIRNIKVLVE